MSEQTSQVTAAVSAAFERVVGERPVRGLDTIPADMGGWDSLAQVQLVYEIEQALGVRLPEDLIVTRTTVGALVEAARAAVGTV
jgi:acyl carrier protein